MKEQNVEYWHHSDDPGLLSCQTLDEAIEDFIECETLPEEPLPEKKIFYGYATPKAKLSGVLEWALECLDDEYVYDDQFTEPTEPMQEAEKAFIDKILSLYEVRCCRRVTQTEVNVRAFEESRVRAMEGR